MPRFAAPVFVVLLLAMSRTDASAQFFRDDFDGTELDQSKWIPDPAGGTIVVANGVVTLTTPGSVFPVVTSRFDPFPPGDFRIRVGMTYLSQQHCGDGFGAIDNFWEDYFGTACRPFLLWEDLGGHYAYAGSAGANWASSIPLGGYHVYEWQYLGGTYSFFIDGEPKASGSCAPRATRVFFGHPHPISCAAPWTSFAIDFIEIEPFGPTASHAPTWGALKQLYR